MPEYDYSKLKGRITEKIGTNQAFARAMGWSVITQSKKMNGKVYWTQGDISRAIKVLDIPETEINVYFFTPKV